MGSSGEVLGRPGRRLSVGEVLVFGCFAIYVTRDYTPSRRQSEHPLSFVHFFVDIIIPRDDKKERKRNIY